MAHLDHIMDWTLPTPNLVVIAIRPFTFSATIDAGTHCALSASMDALYARFAFASPRNPRPAPQLLQNRSLRPSAAMRFPMRTPLRHAPQNKRTLEASTGISLDSRPPC